MFCLMMGHGEGASVTGVVLHRDVTVFRNYLRTCIYMVPSRYIAKLFRSSGIEF